VRALEVSWDTSLPSNDNPKHVRSSPQSTRPLLDRQSRRRRRNASTAILIVFGSAGLKWVPSRSRDGVIDLKLPCAHRERPKVSSKLHHHLTLAAMCARLLVGSLFHTERPLSEVIDFMNWYPIGVDVEGSRRDVEPARLGSSDQRFCCPPGGWPELELVG
jgi:hypothetical protein